MWTLENETTLFPIDPAEITTSPVNQTVNEGESITLSCSAFGIPSPNITWTIPSGKALPLEGTDRIQITYGMDGAAVQSTLTITESVVTDAGVYICMTDNRVPNEIEAIQEATATVTVQSKIYFFPVFLKSPVNSLLLC